MPRISRFATEFTIPGSDRVWLAEFSHQHAREDAKTKMVTGIPYNVPLEPGRVILVQHITTVKLRYKGERVFMTGIAPCSLKDDYNWRKGLHFALQRALEKAGYCKLVKHALTRKIIVVDKKPTYDQVCEAFWREMRIRDHCPHSIPPATMPAMMNLIQHREGVPHGMGAVEQMPKQNYLGTYFAGCD